MDRGSIYRHYSVFLCALWMKILPGASMSAEQVLLMTKTILVKLL